MFVCSMKLLQIHGKGRQRSNWHITSGVPKLRKVEYAHVLETVISDQRRKEKRVKLSPSLIISSYSFNYSARLLRSAFGKNLRNIATSNI